jgi:tRNA-modifying protein YgfZ
MSLANELAAIDTGVGVATISGDDVLRLSGNEALVALDRVVSQEIRTLRDGQGRVALLLAPKGQFRALMAVVRVGDDTLLLAPAGRGGQVAGLLSPYLRFSRVAVEPLPWRGGALRVVGPHWAGVAAALGVDAARVESGCAVAGEPGKRLLLAGQTFAGLPGFTAVAESAAARARLDAVLGTAGAVVVGEPALATARIAAGFPAWGSELTDTVLPPEVGIETLAISYTKGCYVGQETMARMRTYGRPNWRLARLRQLHGPQEAPPLPADLLVAGNEKAKGRLTSWAWHPDSGGIALGLVHRTVENEAELVLPDRRFKILRVAGTHSV